MEQLIDAIGPVNIESGKAIADARAAYDALTEEQRAAVENYKQLQDAEDAFAALLEDVNAAEQVVKLIDAIGQVTLERETAVVNARMAYDALAEDQKGLVSNYDILLAAEARLAELRADADAVAHVKQLIDAIGPVTLNSAQAIADARAAYDALTDAQKAQVDNYAQLQAAEATLKALQDAANGQNNGGQTDTKEDSPKTGDTAWVEVAAVLLIGAVIVLSALRIFRKERR